MSTAIFLLYLIVKWERTTTTTTPLHERTLFSPREQHRVLWSSFRVEQRAKPDDAALLLKFATPLAMLLSIT